MNLIDRIILTIYTAFMACVSAVTVLCSLDLIPHRFIASVIAGIPGNTMYCMGGVILLLVSVRLLVANISPSNSSLLLNNSENGRVQVGISAIEDYAAALAQEIYGVFNVKAIAECKDEKISIRINASIEPGVVIPSTSEDVKNNVREGLKKATAIEVDGVEIYFKQIKAQE